MTDQEHIAREYIRIEFDLDGGADWQAFVRDNAIKYTGFQSFPMCGGVKITGVSNAPRDLPEWARGYD